MEQLKYKIIIHRQALKDRDKIAAVPSLKKKVSQLLEILKKDPYKPPYEKLVGTMEKAYSRRINKQHRLVYTVDDENKEVRILRMWTHYE